MSSEKNGYPAVNDVYDDADREPATESAADWRAMDDALKTAVDDALAGREPEVVIMQLGGGNDHLNTVIPAADNDFSYLLRQIGRNEPA